MTSQSESCCLVVDDVLNIYHPYFEQVYPNGLQLERSILFIRKPTIYNWTSPYQKFIDLFEIYDK